VVKLRLDLACHQPLNHTSQLTRGHSILGESQPQLYPLLVGSREAMAEHSMAPVTQARCLAHPPRVRLPQPAVAAGVAATSSSCRCNVTKLELVVSPLSLLL